MRVDAHAPSRASITIAITFVIGIWAINFLVVKFGLRYIDALTFASFRVVAAGIFMLLIAPLCAQLPMFRQSSEARSANSSTGRLPLATDHSSVVTRHSSLATDLFTFAYLGLFGVAINQFCFTLGLYYTNVTHSSIIVGLAPIYTLTLAVLFGVEHLTFTKASGMALAFTGVALLASSAGMNHHSPTLLGDAITMCGSLGFATYVVLGKRVAAQYNPLTMTTWNFIFGALLVLPIALHQARAVGFTRIPHVIPWQAWLAIVYTGLFSSVLAYLFYFWLLRYLEASQLAAFSYLLPISASALGILFLGERGTWLELSGALLALLGLYWIESSRR
jgi:drug/metabolite transporter (DMT)-like permease